MMRSRTVLWTIAALLGIAVTATLAWTASQIAGQRIGLSSEPLSVASGLAPAPASRHAAIPWRHAHPRSAPHRATSTHAVTLPKAPATTTATAAPASTGSTSAPATTASTGESTSASVSPAPAQTTVTASPAAVTHTQPQATAGHDDNGGGSSSGGGSGSASGGSGSAGSGSAVGGHRDD